MNNFNTMAQPWSVAAPQNNILPIEPDHPFYYKHWPANWEFSYFVNLTGKKQKTTPVFLPGIEMERVIPGVNGVHQINGEIGDPSSRLGKLRQQGHVILEPTQFDYLTVYPAKYGGKKHSPKWQSYRVLAGQVISDFDKQAFDQWRIQLIIDGTITPPDSHFLELYIINEQRVPERLIPSQHLPEVKKQLDSAYKKIDDMTTAMNKIIENPINYYESLLNGK